MSIATRAGLAVWQTGRRRLIRNLQETNDEAKPCARDGRVLRRRARASPLPPGSRQTPNMAEEGEEEPLPPCVWEGELDEGYPVGAVRPPSPRVSLARRARVELIDE